MSATPAENKDVNRRTDHTFETQAGTTLCGHYAASIAGCGALSITFCNLPPEAHEKKDE